MLLSDDLHPEVPLGEPRQVVPGYIVQVRHVEQTYLVGGGVGVARDQEREEEADTQHGPDTRLSWGGDRLVEVVHLDVNTTGGYHRRGIVHIQAYNTKPNTSNLSTVFGHTPSPKVYAVKLELELVFGYWYHYHPHFM